MLHPEIATIVSTLPPASTVPPDPAVVRAAEPHSDTPTVDANGVPVRIYPGAGGAIVYFHGGAFFSGSIDTHDHIARALAKETGLTIVSVGYSLAPEAPFPQALSECRIAVEWAARQGYGENLAVAGDSSGGNFAAVIAAEAPELITHQILYYPSLDLRFDPALWPSLRENAVGYGLEYNGLAPFNSFYLTTADPNDPRVSPILREDLAGLPPALVVTAQFDPLRDEGAAYAARLVEAGVPVTHLNTPNANHGFLQHFSFIDEFYEYFRTTAAFLRG